MDNVGYTGAAGDESRSFVDHHIKTCAGFVVSIVARTQQITAHTGAEFLDYRFVERPVTTCGRHNIDAGHLVPPLAPYSDNGASKLNMVTCTFQEPASSGL
jgi:hypothetical protein